MLGAGSVVEPDRRGPVATPTIPTWARFWYVEVVVVWVQGETTPIILGVPVGPNRVGVVVRAEGGGWVVSLGCACSRCQHQLQASDREKRCGEVLR